MPWLSSVVERMNSKFQKGLSKGIFVLLAVGLLTSCMMRYDPWEDHHMVISNDIRDWPRADRDVEDGHFSADIIRDYPEYIIENVFIYAYLVPSVFSNQLARRTSPYNVFINSITTDAQVPVVTIERVLILQPGRAAMEFYQNELPFSLVFGRLHGASTLHRGVMLGGYEWPLANLQYNLDTTVEVDLAVTLNGRVSRKTLVYEFNPVITSGKLRSMM